MKHEGAGMTAQQPTGGSASLLSSPRPHNQTNFSPLINARQLGPQLNINMDNISTKKTFKQQNSGVSEDASSSNLQARSIIAVYDNQSPPQRYNRGSIKSVKDEIQQRSGNDGTPRYLDKPNTARGTATPKQALYQAQNVILNTQNDVDNYDFNARFQQLQKLNQQKTNLLASSHNETLNESLKSSIHSIKKTTQKMNSFTNGGIQTGNEKGLDLKKIYKTSSFFHGIANQKNNSVEQIQKQVSKDDLAKINQQLFRVPTINEDSPIEQSPIMNSFKQFTKQNLFKAGSDGDPLILDENKNVHNLSRDGLSGTQSTSSIKKNSFDGKYKYWIDPSDIHYSNWVIFLLIINMMWIHVALPIRLSLFEIEAVSLSIQLIDLAVDLLNIADQVTIFFIPSLDSTGGWNAGYVFERKTVVVEYLKSWFLFDLLSNIPYNLFSLSKIPRVFLTLMSFKLIRLRKSYVGIKKLVRKLGFSVVTVRISLTIWNLLMMLHLTASLWGTVGQFQLLFGDEEENWIIKAKLQDEDNIIIRYINNLYWSSTTIMTVGYGDIIPTNNDELIIANVVMIVGICVFTYNLSSLAQQCAEIIKTNSMRGEQHQWAIEYLYHTPNLDERLIHKIEQYINTNMQTKNNESFYQKISLAKQDEDIQEILQLLTPSLRGQLSLFLYKDAIHCIPFLQGRDPLFYLEYLEKLEPLKFQRETVMLKRGTVAQRVYFIVKGRVLNVQTQRIYSDGALIGETDIIYKKRRTETFVALDDIVHVLKIDARILREMMDIFPDIKKDLLEMAKEREIARLRNDPRFQLQLVDHRNKIGIIMDLLNNQAKKEMSSLSFDENLGTNSDQVNGSDIQKNQNEQHLNYKKADTRKNSNSSSGQLVPTQMLKDPEQEAFMMMWQNTTQQYHKAENTNTTNIRNSTSNLRNNFNIEEIETQGREDQGDENFRFDLHRIPQNTKNILEEKKVQQENFHQRSNSERMDDDDQPSRSQRFTQMNQAIFEDYTSENRIVSPSIREEVKAMQQYQAQFQTVQSSNSMASFGNFSFPKNRQINSSNNNDGRDSNLYRSLEQRLARNLQTMEQLIFHTRRVKLLLVQHHKRFQDFLDHLAQSQRHHLVNEEIIETSMNAAAGIQRYINVLQQVERHLEQPTRIAVEDYIKNMRETIRGQEQAAEKAETIIDNIALKVSQLKLQQKAAQSQKQAQFLSQNVSSQQKQTGISNNNGSAKSKPNIPKIQSKNQQHAVKNSPLGVGNQQNASKQSQSSMNSRAQERKEDIDLLVFKQPEEEEDHQPIDLESSQRALIIAVQNPNDRYSTPTMNQNLR